MQIQYKFNTLCSVLSFGLLVLPSLQTTWAYDHVHSIDIGIWTLKGDGIQYKLIHSGITPQHPELMYIGGSINVYHYCSFTETNMNDPWCYGVASYCRWFLFIAIVASMMSVISSFLLATNTKRPTWNGEGKYITLRWPVMSSFIQTISQALAIFCWYKYTKEYNMYVCTLTQVDNFDCITKKTMFLWVCADVFLAFVTYLLWRAMHSYEIAVSKGVIASSFILTAKSNDMDGVLEAIANNVSIDDLGTDGRNALHWACALNRISITHILIKKGASLSKQDRDGWTPLHWAARMGNVDIVRLLAKHNAQVNIQDKWGTSPLMLTVVGESKDAAETLLQLGADVNARTIYGQTALMICIAAGSHLYQMAMLFVNAGAHLHLTDLQGMNALHYTASYGNVNLLRSLLLATERQLHNKKTKAGANLYQLAAIHQHSNVLDFLALEQKQMLDVKDGKESISTGVSDNEFEVQSDSSDSF